MFLSLIYNQKNKFKWSKKKMRIPDWPVYDNEEIGAVKKILAAGKVNYWTGDQSKKFEKEFANWCGTKYAIALSNGSVALTTAYLSVGIKKGDEVITTSRTFIATSSTLVLLGAVPIFADVELDSGCISAKTIENLITNKTKAISVVHLGGWPIDMDSIMELARKHNLYVIEDCSQAHGAEINNRKVGSFGNVATWSFCQDKIISTGGEGGMITTNYKKIKDFIWSYKDHGNSYDLMKKNINAIAYQKIYQGFGTNLRITEMQSAIGRIQLRKLKNWTNIRKRNAEVIINKLKNLKIARIEIPPKNFVHAWYKLYVYLDLKYIKDDWNRDKIIKEIVKDGFPAFSGSCSELYMENCFIEAGLKPDNRLPNAKLLGLTSLMFLIHPTISKAIMDKYAEVIYQVLKKASI